jgi:hypothetical protein
MVMPEMYFPVDGMLELLDEKIQPTLIPIISQVGRLLLQHMNRHGMTRR